MSSQCLWHACRALSAGLLLMLLGAAMAVIGTYLNLLLLFTRKRNVYMRAVKTKCGVQQMQKVAGLSIPNSILPSYVHIKLLIIACFVLQRVR